jgi:DNA-binding beta-propeller fold protein YncE
MKILKKIGFFIGGFLGSLGVAILVWNLFASSEVIAQTTDRKPNFKGQILAISDADMLGSAYADGILNKVAGIEDALSFIGNDASGLPVKIGNISVTNSVVSWPSVLTYHPALKIAYVAETRGIYKGGQDKVKDVWKDLPAGSLMTAVNFSDPNQLQVIQTESLGENIQGATINAKGDLLIAGSTAKGKELVVCKLDQSGMIKEKFYFTDSEIVGADTKNKGFRTAEFHPTENVIAINLNNTHVVFYEILTNQPPIKVRKIGNSTFVAKNWSVGNWTPNGKFFIISDVAWGEGPTGAIFNGKGSLTSIRFDKNGNHEAPSRVDVGLSPEGFDISPDGKYAIVVNMNRTYLPKKIFFVPKRKHPSLSLVKIDQETGKLEKLGNDYGFDGALPEDAIFDTESNSIAVAIFHELHAERPKEGIIEFWEVENDKLVRTNHKVLITRGVHNLKLVK